MTKRKIKTFSDVEKIFKTYIPDYVPPDLRKSESSECKQETNLDKDFTGLLLKKFKEDINCPHTARK